MRDTESKYKSKIVDTNESYTGIFILNWCQYHIDSEKLDFKVIANDIYNNYFSKQVHFKPNIIVYYFVSYEIKHGNKLILLRRDNNKSPRQNPNIKQNISLKQKMRVVNMINLDYNLQYYNVYDIEDAVRLIHYLALIQLRNDAITDNSLDLQVYDNDRGWIIWEDKDGYNINNYEWINNHAKRNE
jgi:hypothetical protein